MSDWNSSRTISLCFYSLWRDQAESKLRFSVTPSQRSEFWKIFDPMLVDFDSYTPIKKSQTVVDSVTGEPVELKIWVAQEQRVLERINKDLAQLLQHSTRVN